MPDTKPFSYIASSLSLNSYQKEEFDRISKLYTKVYNLLLSRWYRFSSRKASPRIDGHDMRFVDSCLNELTQQNWLEDADDKVIATFASNELCRHLREREMNGLPAPHPEFFPITKFDDEVVFYWEYDVRVKERTVRVPVLGKATTGRFKYFSGSIRGIGFRTDPLDGGMQCLIYFRENVAKPNEAAPWIVGSDPIPRSPLNQRLRAEGIGFML